MAPRTSDHGWWPYLGPYGLFLVLVEFGARLPEALETWWLPVKVAGPGLLFLWFWYGGRYPELRSYRPGAAGLLADVLAGLVIAVLWVGPFLVFPELPRGEAEDAFDPLRWGEDGRAWLLGVRLIGFAAVTPFVEELFVRSFLIRMVDVVHLGKDFRRVPIARFTWMSFVVTVVWFTLTHVMWEWGVAFVAGVLFNLWLYRRRHIGATIVAHAVANGAIWLWVVAAGEWGFL